ncbi:MAG: HPP family protein [Actinomycetota bacterium]|nr:HPP family protein [Actinomycetota bacterium]
MVDGSGTGEGMRRLYTGLAARVRPDRETTPGRRSLAIFAFANGTLSIAIVAVAAAVVDEPLVFPSLGPTAYLLSVAPTSRTTSPRNIVVGHLLGVAGGFVALVVFGLTNIGSAFSEGMTLPRAGAAALSLGLTAGLMTWLDADHPPAGATTLIVSLGILTTPNQLTALMLAVVFLAYQGVAVNRLAGLHVPLWSTRTSNASKGC